MIEEVVLVDEHGADIGRMEKLDAHRKGLLHRAFSVFVFDRSGRLLLQRRALTKYHSGGLWTNTCCGHPRPGEALAAAASRRLREEMGIAPALTEHFSFIYRAELDLGLIEHELDHVLFGLHDGEAHPDPAEADAVRYATTHEVDAELQAHPERYTVWFRLCWNRVKEHLATSVIQP